MNAERARGESEHRQKAALPASSPSVARRLARALSTSTAVVAFFALSWIVACSEDAGSAPPTTQRDVGTDETTDCTMRTDLDKYAANMTKTGSTGVYKFQLVSSDPAPPEQQKLVWMLKVLKAGDGSIASELPIRGETSMPDHNHPIPNQPKFAFDPATGIYTVTNIDFGLMLGRWRVRFWILEEAGSDVIIDSAAFDFCIQ